MRLNLSNTPEGHIARLDASLARKGTPVTLRRYVDGTDTAVDLPLLASLRGVNSEQLVGDVTALTSRFVLSPSAFAAVPTWPGAAGGLREPQHGDFLVINGDERKIEPAHPVRIQGVQVRFDGTVSGRAY